MSTLSSATKGNPIKGTGNAGAIKAGDGGARFRTEWPEVDEENHKWMSRNNIDLSTGNAVVVVNNTTTTTPPSSSSSSSSTNHELNNLLLAKNTSRSWIRRNKFLIGAILVFGYVLVVRVIGDTDG